MSSRLRTVAVVLAGGTGTRVGLNIPKQLLKVAGKTDPRAHPRGVRGRARDRRDRRADGAGPRRGARRIASAGFRKVTTVMRPAAAPATRRPPALTALERARRRRTATCSSTTPYARCWTTGSSASAWRHWAATTRSTSPSPPPTRSSWSTRRVDHRHPRRAALRRGQTPQAFRLSTIRRAYELAWQDPDFAATDDCSVVLRYLPDVPDQRGRRLRAQHEGHPPDRRLPRRPALPAGSARPPRRADPDAYRRAAGRQDARRLRRQLRHRRGHRRAASPASAPTSSRFSRSATGTHVEDAEDVEAALRTAFDADRPDRLRRRHRRGAATAAAGRPPTR